MRRRILVWWVATISLFGIFPLAAVAQVAASASISGRVTDPQGAVVPFVRVTVRDTRTNVTRSVLGDESGLFQLVALPPSTYEVLVEREGFIPWRRMVELTVGARVTLEIQLLVGGITEQVTVTAEQVVDPVKTERSEVIGERKIEDLPISGRQFIDFALLTPNAVIGKSVTFGATGPFQEFITRLSFGGLRESQTNLYLLDGADHSVTVSGLQHLTPSQEATREFRVLTSNYAAEFGPSRGAVVNIITKSGSERFHGALYNFFRNDNLDATNILSAPGFDVLRQNQFGASVGGPIRRGQTFFFANYEGQRRAASPIYSSFLLGNIEAINRVKRFYGLSPENLALLRIDDSDQLLVRGDHYASGHQHLVRYLFVDQRNHNVPGAPGNSGGPSSFRDNPIRDQSLLYTLTIPSSTLVNEALFQYSRRTFGFTSVSNEPNLTIANLLELGRNIGPVDRYRETRVQIADNLTWARGGHTVKAGLNINHIRDRLLWPVTVNGLAVFIPDSFFGAPPFNNPTPVFMAVGIPRSLVGRPIPPRSTDFRRALFPAPEFEEAARIAYTHETYEAFVQDQWRVTPSFTLTYGVRYFVETVPFDGWIEGDHNNVQPRLGFAWAFNQNRGVLRGGVGLFHGLWEWGNLLGDFTYFGGNGDDIRRFDPTLAAAFGTTGSRGVSLAPIPIPSVTGPAFFDFVTRGQYPTDPLVQFLAAQQVKDTPNPYAEQANLQLEHELPGQMRVSLGWLWVHGLKMTTLTQLNVVRVGTLPSGKPQYAPRDQRFGIYFMRFPGSTSVYHGGTVSLSKRFGYGFSFDAHYTWSKTIDLLSSLSFLDAPEDPMNLRLERGLSNQHVGHRFVLSLLARAPDRGVFRHFKLGLLTTLESPRYRTIFVGFDANGDLQTGPDRVGTLGRNTYKGDSFKSVDLRLSREVFLSERISLEVIAEAFNLLNTVNVTAVDTIYLAPDLVGPLPRRFGDGVKGPNPNFGNPLDAANPRQVQLAVKVRW
jgi:hypothetical protein